MRSRFFFGGNQWFGCLWLLLRCWYVRRYNLTRRTPSAAVGGPGKAKKWCCPIIYVPWNNHRLAHPPHPIMLGLPRKYKGGTGGLLGFFGMRGGGRWELGVGERESSQVKKGGRPGSALSSIEDEGWMSGGDGRKREREAEGAARWRGKRDGQTRKSERQEGQTDGWTDRQTRRTGGEE
ncbi:hypothetical protein BZA77DRAFT_125345 [Pyronema omphalodes]|nr:hypothetical protein BZA77DRAFT_125345 [Pyronema omphalodes]